MKQYSFYSVDLLLDGVAVTGFNQSNAIITADRASPQHIDVIGARGEMAVATVADQSGTIAFSLMQTSDWNQVMQARALLDQNTGLSGNVATFTPYQAMINDKMGSTLVVGVNGYTPKQPAVVRGIGIVNVNWVIRFEELYFTRGTYENVGL